MIGIDTNILLRYVLADDRVQHGLAANLIDETCSEDEPAFLSEIVLVEAVWYLVKKQRRAKQEIVDLLFALADNPHLHLADEAAHLAAVNAYAEGRGDFAEYLIAASNAVHGVRTTYTFDRDASKDGVLTLLQGA